MEFYAFWGILAYADAGTRRPQYWLNYCKNVLLITFYLLLEYCKNVLLITFYLLLEYCKNVLLIT